MQDEVEGGQVVPDVAHLTDVEPTVKDQPGQDIGDLVRQHRRRMQFLAGFQPTSRWARTASWRSSATTTATITLASTTTLTRPGPGRRAPRPPGQRRRRALAPAIVAPADRAPCGRRVRPPDRRVPAEPGVHEHTRQGPRSDPKLLGLLLQGGVVGLVEANGDGFGHESSLRLDDARLLPEGPGQAGRRARAGRAARPGRVLSGNAPKYYAHPSW